MSHAGQGRLFSKSLLKQGDGHLGGPDTVETYLCVLCTSSGRKDVFTGCRETEEGPLYAALFIVSATVVVTLKPRCQIAFGSSQTDAEGAEGFNECELPAILASMVGCRAECHVQV